MLYNFQIKFNASNENETFEPLALEKLYTFYQQSLGSSSDVLSFSFWMAAAAEAAATSFSVWGSKLLLNAVCANITHYVPLNHFSSTTFIIDETALFFVRGLYEFLRLWLGEFLPEGGEHVHQVPGVDAAVVILVKNPASSPWSITALQIICHKHSDWGIAKLKPAPSRIFLANNY